jgi:mono/diheme cytochrome c family protein
MQRLRQICAIVLGVTSTLGAATDEDIFKEKLQPVLAKNCAGCHTGANAQAGLSVDSLQGLTKGGKRGPAIHPGSGKTSPLVQFARGEQNPRMPVGGKPLDPATIDAIAAAIDSMTPVAVGASADDHEKWLYSSPSRPQVPAAKAGDWVRNPIDAFVLARLEAKGFKPAPPASKRALLRRVYFDLIGLPPTVEEAQAFLRDESPDAYEKLIDKLLADKRYGERWGRHWLDLVRFAESDGFAVDSERPTAWRYRDYVIRAFNNDKPYDIFVQEQIAGDEMERSGGGRRMADGSEGTIALGYLRMAPWEADANFDNQLRLDWLNEMTTTTSQVFMGLTVGCARCHDHKYDPIPQRDFYRMQAFFASTRVEERPAPFSSVEDPQKKMRSTLRKYEDDIEDANERLRVFEGDLRKRLGESGSGEGLNKALADKKNTAITEAERKQHKELQESIKRLTSEMARYRPVAYSVNEVAPPAILEIAPTHVLGGGELAAKGDQVEPGFLKRVIGKEEDAKIPFAGRYRSGRRRALAEWIASPSNPFTARVMVNRIWQHHFGEGLVRTSSDFGKNGERPSHPELLDWLATEFVEKKWSVKAMHKLMLMSNAYRQSTSHPESKQYAENDPDNRLLWRMNWIRLESEALRDSVLALSGRLNSESGGPGMFFNVKDEIAQGFEFFKWYASEEKQQLRRSIYAFQRRSLMMPMLEVFDGANMSESCSRRSVTTVAPQALTLLNGELTSTESKHFAKRVLDMAPESQDRQIDAAFQLVLFREASATEKEQARTLFNGRTSEQALTRLATVLFNLNEFIYLE